MVFVPHSPRWLVKKGRVDEARRVLERTRGGDADIDGELEQIKSVTEHEKGWSILDLFSTKARALMLIGIGLAVVQQFVGVNTVIYFASTIIGYTGFTTDTAVLLAVIVGVTNFVVTIVAVLVMDWVGRRGLLLVGTAILTVSLIVLGAYFQFSALSHGVPLLGVICVIVYIVRRGPGSGVLVDDLRDLPVAVPEPGHGRGDDLQLGRQLPRLVLLPAADGGDRAWPHVLDVRRSRRPGDPVLLEEGPETKNRPLEDIERDIGGEELASAVSADQPDEGRR